MRARMSKFLTLILLLCIAAATLAQTSGDTPPSPSDTRNVAGKIDLIDGDARFFDNQKKRRTVQVGDKVYEGDSIVTGRDGEVHLTMEDEGFIAVRSNTQMRIAQYRAQGDDQDRGVIALVVGSLRSITGWIGKYRPQSYVVRTPTATIGIRGTDHEPMVIPEGAVEGEPGTYDKVNAGGTSIKTPQGSVDVSEHQAAFAPHAGRGGMAGPRVLESVPSFYRPSRNEHLIEGKHEAIQRTLAGKREAKRQQFNGANRGGMNRAPGNRMNRAEERNQLRENTGRQRMQNERNERATERGERRENAQPQRNEERRGENRGNNENQRETKRDNKHEGKPAKHER